VFHMRSSIAGLLHPPELGGLRFRMGF
jgi:hypothetical protein